MRDAARRRLEGLVDPAIERLRELLTSKATNDRTVLAAVREVLNRAGIDPPVQGDRITVEEAEEVLDAEIKRLEELLGDHE